jgi:Flp pilus assembly protein CpaB
MKRKPLFITLIVAVAVIGIVAVVLFIKDVAKPSKSKQLEPEPEQEPEQEQKTEPKTE